MKYFLDTKFITGRQKEVFPISLFRKETPKMIDLLSIAIVSEDGREYHAISKDFNLEAAWNRFELEEGYLWDGEPMGKIHKNYWFRENILKQLLCDLYKRDVATFHKEFGNFNNFIGYMEREKDPYILLKRLISKFGKTNKQIAYEVKMFIYYSSQINDPEAIENWEDVKHQFPVDFFLHQDDISWIDPYFNSSGHSWSAFCGLFDQIPQGFPRYYTSLDQMQREHFMVDIDMMNYCEAVHDIGKTYPSKKVLQAVFADNENLEQHPRYPKRGTASIHCPLEKARWYRQLHNFLSNT